MTRAATAAVVAFAIGMVLVALSGNDDLVRAAYGVGLVGVVVLPVTGVFVAAFLWRVYLSDTNRPRSRTVWLFAAGSTIIDAASFLTLFLASRVLFNARDPIAPEVYGILIATAICTMLLVVHLFGLHVWRAWTGRITLVTPEPPPEPPRQGGMDVGPMAGDD